MPPKSRKTPTTQKVKQPQKQPPPKVAAPAAVPRNTGLSAQQKREVAALIHLPSAEQLRFLAFAADYDGKPLASSRIGHGITVGDGTAAPDYEPCQNGGLAHSLEWVESRPLLVSIPAGKELRVVNINLPQDGTMFTAAWRVADPGEPLVFQDPANHWQFLTGPQDSIFDEDVAYRPISGYTRVTHDLPSETIPPSQMAARIMGSFYPAGTVVAGESAGISVVMPPGNAYPLGPAPFSSFTAEQFVDYAEQTIHFVGRDYDRGCKVGNLGPVSGAPNFHVGASPAEPTVDLWRDGGTGSFEVSAAATILVVRNNAPTAIPVSIESGESYAVHHFHDKARNTYTPGADPHAMMSWSYLYHSPAFAGPNSFLTFLKSVGRNISAPFKWAGGLVTDLVRSGKAQSALASAMAGGQAAGPKGAALGALTSLLAPASGAGQA